MPATVIDLLASCPPGSAVSLRKAPASSKAEFEAAEAARIAHQKYRADLDWYEHRARRGALFTSEYDPFQR